MSDFPFFLLMPSISTMILIRIVFVLNYAQIFWDVLAPLTQILLLYCLDPFLARQWFPSPFSDPLSYSCKEFQIHSPFCTLSALFPRPTLILCVFPRYFRIFASSLLLTFMDLALFCLAHLYFPLLIADPSLFPL